MHISLFFLLWMLSFCFCFCFCFFVFLFFLRKKRLCLCFHYFDVAGLVHLWKWSIFVKCGIKHVNKCVWVHLTTGGVFLFIHVFDIFQLPVISIAVSPFFSFFMWFCSFLNCTVSPSIVMLYWMESTFAVFIIIQKNCIACMLWWRGAKLILFREDTKFAVVKRVTKRINDIGSCKIKERCLHTKMQEARATFLVWNEL